MNTIRILALSLLVVPALLSAQTQSDRIFYYPKPVARTAWQSPMRPITRLAEVRARHKDERAWRELVIHDENSRAFLVQEAAGTKREQRLYPDSPAWWAVVDGRVRFDVEKPDRTFETFEASKGSYVFVPERMLHAFEVVGNQPAILFEVTLASATPVYPQRPAQSPPGVEYIPVRLTTGPNPLDVPDPGGKRWPIHFNVHDLAKQNDGRKNWTQEAIRKNRARGNLICGHAGADQPVGPANRGHFHSDFAEFWVVMLGELRWTFEGDVPGSIVAAEGDIVYAPPKTWHAPQFWGKQGLNCRLTSSTYPSANHFYDPVVPVAVRQAPQPEAPDRPLRVMTYNIKHGQSNAACTQPPSVPGQPPSPDCNLNLEGTIAVLRAHTPDVVALQEVDRFWARSAYADQPALVAAGLQMPHHCFAPNLDHPADHHSTRPHQYGTAIVSRFPISNCSNTLLTTFPGWEQRGVLGGVIEVEGVRLRVYSTHLQAGQSVGGVSESGAPQRVLQVQEIMKLVSEVTDPIALMGDFNAGPTSTEMTPIRPRLLDVWSTARASMGYTSPAELEGDPTSRIDYIFVSPNVRIASVSVPIDAQTRLASDHYPVVASVLVQR